jgi:D-alanyl-D-alanine carboxypeptidase (penicillin-binding protein 5/6)
VAVYKGMEDTAKAVVDEEVSVLIPKGEKKVMEHKVELLPSIKAPFEAGTKVGEVVYMVNGKEAARANIVTKEAVDKVNVEQMLHRLLKKWCEF